MRISVIIPARNAADTLPTTLESLAQQTFRDFEVIVVDDASTDGGSGVGEAGAGVPVKVLRNETQAGPAATRNRGIRNACADILAFTDADATAPADWLERIDAAFDDPGTNVVVGNVVAPPSTFLGDAIAAQGFPGGGSIGFDRMWRVSSEGFTHSITSCNFAARKETFSEYGDFDESFPFAGGEDSELACRLVHNGVRIRYDSSVIVCHPPRKDFSTWVRWQVSRGRSSYHFKQKVGDVSDFVRLRAWSSWNVVKASLRRPLLCPLVITLLGLSFLLQRWGYFAEKRCSV